MINVDTTEETLQFNFICRARHRHDGVNPGREWLDAGGVHDVPQVRDGGRGKDALLPVETQSSLVQTAKNLSEVREMLLGGGAGHEDVVQVDEDAVKPAKDPVHQTLERLCRVL